MKYSAAQFYCLLGEISLKRDLSQKKAPFVKTSFEKAIAICRKIKAENQLALA